MSTMTMSTTTMTTTTTATTTFSKTIQDREEFLNDLAAQYGVFEKEEWTNNNKTLKGFGFILAIKKMKWVGEILAKSFQYNITTDQKPIRAVPVAGWSEKENNINVFSAATKEGRREIVTDAYGHSFSLSNFTTAENADIIMRIARSAHKMHLYKNSEGAWRFDISPGVTVTEAEQYLASQGLAMPTVNTTLHVCSWVGAANADGYGPAGKKESMTSIIEAIEGYTGDGQKIRLSATENAHLFDVIVNANLGACVFMSKVTIKDIRKDFFLERRDTLLKNTLELEKHMRNNNLFENDGGILHFFPAGIGEPNDNHWRIRLSAFNETKVKPTKKTALQPHADVHEYLDLEETNLGEPAIYELVKKRDLRKFLPVFWKLAANKTFGDKKEHVQIGHSAETIHIIRTYTSLPLTDINWLIEVKDPVAARDLLVGLMKLVEEKLTELATRKKDPKYPILTVFSRFLKGHYFPEGRGGVASTAVHTEGYSILSFELLTYTLLQKTGSFKMVQNSVIQFLETNGFKYKYHPGKTWPEGLYSLTQTFKDSVEVPRLKRFQDAVILMNGGLKKYRFSPLLTPQKQVFIFGDSHAEKADSTLSLIFEPADPQPPRGKPTREERKKELERRESTLDKVISLAHEHKYFDLKQVAVDMKSKK